MLLRKLLLGLVPRFFFGAVVESWLSRAVSGRIEWMHRITDVVKLWCRADHRRLYYVGQDLEQSVLKLAERGARGHKAESILRYVEVNSVLHSSC